MKISDIAHMRLRNQQIVATRMKTPADVVAHFGAIQGQDYAGAKWSIGLRLPHATDAEIEQAIASRTIVRSWPMRGTLHFVAAKDIRWMIALTGERTIKGHRGRYRQLGLDDATINRSTGLIMKALQGGKSLNRPELLAMLEHNGVVTTGQRGIYLLERVCQEGLVCQGSTVRGKAFYFEIASLPPSAKKTQQEALAELARRYFTSHGPASLPDFVWWSGLKITDARSAMEMIKHEFITDVVDGRTYMMPAHASAKPESSPSMHLLPGFDEFLLAYKERGASLEPGHKTKWSPGNNGMFFPLIIVDGRVVGVWKRVLKKDTVIITPHPFDRFSHAEERLFTKRAEEFADFLGLNAVIEKSV